MFSKGKNWIQQAVWKPKNLHSLEHLKFLYHVLMKNQVITEQNKSLLVETLRSISEILIWGDQNDSTVFDFFLEKNMLAFFLRILRQRTGRYVCVQVLQTLNILFENIRNETSLYYLLSNNHVNCIIVHKFDFSDEEILAYYISFLKTLSLKLNPHTIHFFYNEHTNDFALYTEAIKFFNHPESMVRIAVRTLTLNVYKVNDKAMLMYIRNRTAAPYFSNLVWFIGNHVLELDSCVRNDTDHQSRNRLSDLVAEHLDHLHYLNDILQLNIESLNEILTDQLLNRLLVPLYVFSLTKDKKYDQKEEKPHVNSVVSLFLLSQVFLILSHFPVINTLAECILNGDVEMIAQQTTDIGEGEMTKRGFVPPSETLEKSLESSKASPAPYPEQRVPRFRDSSPEDEGDTPSGGSDHVFYKMNEQNSTDEEKSLGVAGREKKDLPQKERPYWTAIINALSCNDSDYKALFALCLLYAMGTNSGVKPELLQYVNLTTVQKDKSNYNVKLVERLITTMSQSCQYNSKVRPATLHMAIILLKELVYGDKKCFLQDMHLACVEGAREESKLMLRNFYKGDELFLDMFEDEYKNLQMRPLNVEFLMMDASILLPPTGTPLTGIEFAKRLPSGDLERTRRAIRVFFLLRDLSLTLSGEEETRLPLTKQEELVKIADKLDLNNRDLIACTVIHKDKVTTPKRQRRFLVIDPLQLILVEPDSKKLGWGVGSFAGPLQDVEVTGDKEDSRSLRVTIHKRANSAHVKPTPLLAARFIFDDHIRCMAAKQRLTKGRTRARQRKMECIGTLLDLPMQSLPSTPQTPTYPGPLQHVSSHPGMAVPASAVQQPQPFRAYSDHGFRRLSGQQQPEQNVKKPGIASAEKLPNFESGQRHSVEFVRQVPASSMGMRMSAPVPVRPSSSQPTSHGYLPQAAASASPEVEQALEATAPSAFASSVADVKRGPQTGAATAQQHDRSITAQGQEPIQDSESLAMSPSLSPAKAPPTSLLSNRQEPDNECGSPKILPPTSTERVRSLSNASAGSEGASYSQSNAENTQRLSFGKSQAQIDVNPANAKGASSSPGKSRITDIAKDSLTRFTQRERKPSTEDVDGIEMTSFNITATASSLSPTDEDQLDVGIRDGWQQWPRESPGRAMMARREESLPEVEQETPGEASVTGGSVGGTEYTQGSKHTGGQTTAEIGEDLMTDSSTDGGNYDPEGTVETSSGTRDIESDHSSDFDTIIQDIVKHQLSRMQESHVPSGDLRHNEGLGEGSKEDKDAELRNISATETEEKDTGLSDGDCVNTQVQDELPQGYVEGAVSPGDTGENSPSSQTSTEDAEYIKAESEKIPDIQKDI
ncbi:protein CLEC16A-like isoform X2 [Ptychodera flava]|uniref:protein CLEC16A-like isoform X2 n=1 Tax=Ptychodera flava TaxID=63121 RepID=UPI00396A7730